MKVHTFKIDNEEKTPQSVFELFQKLENLFEDLEEYFKDSDERNMFRDIYNKTKGHKESIDPEKYRTTKEILLSPINDLGFSKKVKELLLFLKIDYNHELVSKNESDLIHFKGIGRKSLQELGDYVDELGGGVRFGMDVKKYIE
jgi:DNA-directed RNA polymerase alpha subunit